MKKNIAKEIITDLLCVAGITINGDAPWDITVHDERLYQRLLSQTELGLGESYMDGWWDCPRIDLLITRLAEADLETKLKTNFNHIFKILLSRFLNFQTKKRSLQVGIKHYDLGNDLFQVMLDRDMSYTCGYWKNAKTLDEAQQAKLDLVCKKLALKPGMRMLDIGCGWGSLAKYAAEHYGVEVVGLTISQSQCELAKVHCKKLPIEIRFQDYRDVNEPFDRVVSLGMFEHVGHLNYRTYMEVVNRCLVETGLFLLHTIGINSSTTYGSPWVSKYIFPNSMLPSIAQIGKATEHLFILQDWHNFGLDYYKTLMAWHEQFNQGWGQLKDHYDGRFFRMWNYFLLFSAGGFQARENQLWQIVFSKQGYKERYKTVR